MQKKVVLPSTNFKTLFVEALDGKGFHSAQFKTPQLSIFSYYIQSQGQAILIDPTIDTEIYTQYLAKRNTKLSYVVLTHYHTDYLSGHLQFNVPIIMGQTCKRTFEVTELKDNHVLQLGEIKIIVFHTPGHALQSSCFLLTDRDGDQISLYTGDTLFINEVGRPDLIVSQSIKKQDLAGMLYDSLQKLRVLKPNVRIYPGHGAGSLCGKNIGEGNWSTIQNQLKNNYAFQIPSKPQFITTIFTGLPPPPKYYFNVAQLNQKGPNSFITLFNFANRKLSVEEFMEKAKTAVVIDVRINLDNIRQGFIKGAYLLSQAGTIINWIGTLFDPKSEFIIFIDDEKAGDLIERITRIGYSVIGYNGFTLQDWKKAGGQITILKFATLDDVVATQNRIILDVRNPPQTINAVVEGSINVPFIQLEKNIQKIPKDKTIFVHCKTGVRARQSACILSKYDINSSVLALKFEDFSTKLKIVKPT